MRIASVQPPRFFTAFHRRAAALLIVILLGVSASSRDSATRAVQTLSPKPLLEAFVPGFLRFWDGSQAGNPGGETPSEHHSTLAFTIPEKDLIPEGIAYDPVGGCFYVGSIYRHKIVKVNRAGQVSNFTSERQDGLADVLGLRVDARRRVLWACSETEPGTEPYGGYSWVFKYDLRSGKLIKKYTMDSGSGPHLFNDIVITRSGDAYLTDSREGAVYAIPHRRDRLELFVERKSFDYPNGIALAPDEGRLFVAAFDGIYAVDLKTGKRSALGYPSGEVVAGLDGMYFYRDSLIGVQNGLKKSVRVVRLYLAPEMDRVERLQVLEQDHTMFQIPTTGAIVGGWFYYIANSQLRNLSEDGKLVSPEQLQEVKILRLRL